MSEVARPQVHRHATARLRRRRDDVWIGIAAIAASMMALPFAQNSWHGPEVAAVLAVSATALLAGQRWAIALIVLTELLLMPTLWPRVFLGDGDLVTRVAALGSLLAIVPGLLVTRRAAAALVLVLGQHRTRVACRRLHKALIAVGVIATFLPLL